MEQWPLLPLRRERVVALHDIVQAQRQAGQVMDVLLARRFSRASHHVLRLPCALLPS